MLRGVPGPSSENAGTYSLFQGSCFGEGLYFGVLSVSDSLALSCFRSGPHRSCGNSVPPLPLKVNLLLFCLGHTVTPLRLANSGWPSKHLRGRVQEEERPSLNAWHFEKLYLPC